MATAKKSAATKGGAKKAAAKPAARGAATSATKGGAARGSAAKTSTTTKGGAKSAAKGGASKSAAKGATKSTRAPNPAFMRPMRPSAALGAVVGTEPMPRSEITSRVWAYIKKNGLQDQQNRRQINADDRLRPVFGGQNSVSMFEMTKLVNNHLSNG